MGLRTRGLRRPYDAQGVDADMEHERGGFKVKCRLLRARPTGRLNSRKPHTGSQRCNAKNRLAAYLDVLPELLR
jgi:hypothetical protein